MPRRIGRPDDVGNAAFDVADLLRFAAAAIEQPDLRALLFLVFRASGRNKGEILAVGAPSRR